MRLALLLCLLPTLGYARCAHHEALEAALRNQWSETQQIVAIQSDGRLMEVFASEAGTWTVVVTAPNGVSCPVAHGEDYQHTNTPFWQEEG